MRDFNETQLIELAQKGNLNAIGKLYDHYWRRIFNYVRAKVYDVQLAQDLTGEIFLRMVEHLSDYQIREGVPFSAWLYRIAHNLIINQHQKENAYQIVPIEYANLQNHPDDNPALVIEKQLERMRILQCLERIDATQREVIILRFLAGLSLKEAADVLNKTVGAVKTLQRRGMLALLALLKMSMEDIAEVL